MYLKYTVLLICVSNALPNSAPQVDYCNLADTKCVKDHGQALYEKILEGNPKTGAEDLDPMHHEVIDGQLSFITFKLTKTTLEGFKKCKVERFVFNSTTLVTHTRILCPEFKFYGNYDIQGKLTPTLPIEGNGEYSILTKDYSIDIDVELEILKGSDGESFAAAKAFSVVAEALAPIVFDFKNLFNGQKELADTVQNYVNEHWKEISMGLQGPAFNAHFKKIIANLNKFLKNIPSQSVL